MLKDGEDAMTDPGNVVAMLHVTVVVVAVGMLLVMDPVVVATTVTTVVKVRDRAVVTTVGTVIAVTTIDATTRTAIDIRGMVTATPQTTGTGTTETEDHRRTHAAGETRVCATNRLVADWNVKTTHPRNTTTRTTA